MPEVLLGVPPGLAQGNWEDIIIQRPRAPTSGTTATNFNFTVDYRHPDGTPAGVVRVNVSDAANGTYNNFTMSPAEDPDVNTFVQTFQDLTGTTSNFTNAQSDSDSGTDANENTVAVQFIVSIPGGSTQGTYGANLTIRVQQRPAG